jgi:hypothetical protein
VTVEDAKADDAIEKQKAKLPPGLFDILNRTDGVNEYRIFNEDDFVLDKSETVDSALKIMPSDYLKFAEPLAKQIASGRMDYFQINTRKGARYIFLKYQDTRLILSLKQKFQPDSLLKTLSELNPDV